MTLYAIAYLIALVLAIISAFVPSRFVLPAAVGIIALALLVGGAIG